MICVTLHVHCSVLLQMRHSSTDGIGPYVVYSPPMVGTIPLLVVAAAPRDDHL